MNPTGTHLTLFPKCSMKFPRNELRVSSETSLLLLLSVFFPLHRVKHTGHFTDYGNQTIWTNEKQGRKGKKGQHTGHFTDYGNPTIWTNEKEGRRRRANVTWKVV
jgi:hypothetical protein